MRRKSPPKIPLKAAWKATSGVDWWDNNYDLSKAFLCSVFSELVYRDVSSLEVGDQNRMWMVPCRAYQQIAAGIAVSDFRETLQEMGAFEAAELFRSPNTIGVGFKHNSNELIIVALRGTSRFYDYVIDFLCNPFYGLRPSKQPRFHQGFKLETQRCFPDMLTRLQAWGAPDVPVYLTGHSLGGAIAGVMMAMQSNVAQVKGKCLINSAYTFGMPRYGNDMAVNNPPMPYPTIRAKDPVLWLPPEGFGYFQCQKEYDVHGKPVKRKALGRRISLRPFSHHAIEEYRKDMHQNFP